MRRMKQINLLKKSKYSYGGELMKSRAGRRGPRPLDTKNTMHLVLRSSKAKGEWSFLKRENKLKIQKILNKFSARYGIQILSFANVGNHLHLHLKLTNRFGYKPFIRAVTSTIAMAVTKCSRWSRGGYGYSVSDSSNANSAIGSNNAKSGNSTNGKRTKFWDYRPFTRIIFGFAAFKRLNRYIKVNQLEPSNGRALAELMVYGDKQYGWVPIG